MGPHRSYRERRYAFGELLLALRTRAALTQIELASQIGVHRRSVQNWETGEAYPKADSLQRLIVVFVDQHVFRPGQEIEEARQLWEQARRDAPHQLPQFDAAWFGRLVAKPLSGAQAAGTPADSADSSADPRQPDGPKLEDTSSAPANPRPIGPMPSAAGAMIDWGEAIDVPALYGRDGELATLTAWAGSDHCRVIALLGLGGIGKTSLAIRFGRQASAQFEVVIFRSLRNAPPIAGLLDGLIHLISDQRVVPSERVADKIGQLVVLLRERRCLIILDNAETLMQGGAQAGQFRAGYTDYGSLIARLAGTQHQGCLLLTSREKPTELGPLEGHSSPVRTLPLRGLDDRACHAVLEDRALFGTNADWARLGQIYSGNPLALKLVSEPIREIFGGDIATFLETGDAFFNGVGHLLDAQYARSTPLEQTLLLWLAIRRDLAPLDSMVADLAGAALQREVLQALESLRRRYLIERAEGRAAFTLQAVVLEYLTSRIVEEATAELISGKLDLLRSHALMQARAREYVRQSQERLLVAPVLARLRQHWRTEEAVAALLIDRLTSLRELPHHQQRYGGGNLATLLALLRGDLRDVDLSELALRQPFFAGLQMQGADLRGARLDDAVFSELMNPVNDVAVSADGQYLAAATVQGELRIWRTAELVQVAASTDHSAQVWAIAFRPNSSPGSIQSDAMLASGGFDGIVRLWPAPFGPIHDALHGHQGNVWDVAWPLDGSVLASAGEDGTVRLWDADRRTEHAVLAPEGAGAAYALAWHPDGATLASGHADGSIRLWAADPSDSIGPNARAGNRERARYQFRERALIQGQAGPIWALAWSPDGATLAGAGADATIRLWEDQLHERAVLRGHSGLILGLDWHPGGYLLASGGADGSVRLWDSAQRRTHAVLDGHNGSVSGVAFGPDGASLISGGQDQTVRLWDMPSGQPRTTLLGYSQWTFAVAWSADGQLASAGSDGVVQIWDTPAIRADMPPPRLRQSLVGHSNYIFSLAYSPDQRQLASAALDGTLRVWDIATGRARLTLSSQSSFVTSAAWSNDGRLLASAGDDRAITIWEAASGAEVRTLNGHTETIWSVAWRPSASVPWLASASSDCTIVVWDAASGARLHTLEGHSSFVRCVSWHPEGQMLASCSADNSVRVWDAASGAELAVMQQHSNDVRAVAWHPDGRLLVSASEDGTIRLWTLSAPGNRAPIAAAMQIAERAVLHGGIGQMRAVAWSPDGRLLAAGGEGGWIVVWDTEAVLAGHTADAKRAQFRGDRPYERMRIGGALGLTEAQRLTLLALGAVE